MKARHKKKAIIGIPLGLLCFGGGIFLAVHRLGYLALIFALVFGGLGLYVWDCLALAKTKGYSSAIVLTVVLGVLFPVVVLLALPDKNKQTKGY